MRYRRREFKASKLRWVYIILIKKEMVYVGSSEEPLRRFKSHASTIWMKYLKGKIQVRIYGPYKWTSAYDIERELIHYFGDTKILLNNNYGKAIKKSGKKAQKLERQSTVERRLSDQPGMVFNY